MHRLLAITATCVHSHPVSRLEEKCWCKDQISGELFIIDEVNLTQRILKLILLILWTIIWVYIYDVFKKTKSFVKLIFNVPESREWHEIHVVVCWHFDKSVK